MVFEYNKHLRFAVLLNSVSISAQVFFFWQDESLYLYLPE